MWRDCISSIEKDIDFGECWEENSWMKNAQKRRKEWYDIVIRMMVWCCSPSPFLLHRQYLLFGLTHIQALCRCGFMISSISSFGMLRSDGGKGKIDGNTACCSFRALATTTTSTVLSAVCIVHTAPLFFSFSTRYRRKRKGWEKALWWRRWWKRSMYTPLYGGAGIGQHRLLLWELVYIGAYSVRTEDKRKKKSNELMSFQILPRKHPAPVAESGMRHKTTFSSF